jgi:hypothetical protein
VAPPTYYCSRNTQITKEKSWNENKVLQLSNTDKDVETQYFASLRALPRIPATRNSFSFFFDGEFSTHSYAINEWKTDVSTSPIAVSITHSYAINGDGGVNLFCQFNVSITHSYAINLELEIYRPGSA